MRIFIFILLALITFPAFALKSHSQNEIISSNVAVSQTGRFAVSYFSPLIMDKKGSSDLTYFIAYRDIITKKQIVIGAIPGDYKLSYVCKNPVFLQSEKIADVSTISDSSIHYFTTNQYRGCIIDFNKNQSALVIEISKPFTSQGGEKINHIGIVADAREINKLKNNISFNIPAKDYFLNLLQFSQTFSPFSNEINWHSIKNKGMEFIGSEKVTCRGLSAAAKFLTPELNKLDLHSFITLNGLGTSLCPMAPIPENDGMKKWLSVPESTRKTIIKYSSDFHGYKLNKRIAYLYIPAMDAFDPATINDMVTKGRGALANAKIDKASGLIIDLRFNHGGSIVPMLLTLGGMLPSGKLFSIGKNTPIYLSDNRNKLFLNTSHDNYGQYDGKSPNKHRYIPVAILTNWMTASSGNITRLALRDNVSQAKVFGEKTSPTTSINETFYLLDGNTLNLTVDRLYDKNGNIVPLELPADEDIKEENLETIFDPSMDKTLSAAKKWLESQPRCKKDSGDLSSTSAQK
jgi:Peptidase family S41